MSLSEVSAVTQPMSFVAKYITVCFYRFYPQWVSQAFGVPACPKGSSSVFSHFRVLFPLPLLSVFQLFLAHLKVKAPIHFLVFSSLFITVYELFFLNLFGLLLWPAYIFPTNPFKLETGNARKAEVISVLYALTSMFSTYLGVST